MSSITQDMRFRLSLIKYTQKHGVTKTAIKYKTNRQYINVFMTALLSLYKTALADLINTWISISLMKSSLLPICAGATLMQVLLYSG